ncbi:MAG: glycosyltransferase family 4 protein [Candidatus Binataceae bacterium]
MLNRSFWPDLEATGQFLTELCEDLAERHDITVICGPSYHLGARSMRPFSEERRGRVRILRTWGTRLAKARLAARLVNLGTYYALAAVRSMTLARPDVIIAETDPPLLGMLGALLKRRHRCKLVYNVRDIYPDIALVNGGVRSRALLGLLRGANRLAYQHADLVVTLGRDMRERIIAKGVPASKVAVVPDWVDTTAIRPIAPNAMRAEFGDKFVVMYSGNLGLSQQLDTVLDAARALCRDPRIVFVLVGDGARKQWLQEHARALALDNLLFLPYRSKDRLAESLSAADLHLIPLARGAAGCLVPSKVYGILAAGRPYVAMMEERGEVARLAIEHGVGFVVAPGDAPALAATIARAVNNASELKSMGSRARTLAEQSFSRRAITAKFEAMLDGVTSQAGASADSVLQP